MRGEKMVAQSRKKVKGKSNVAEGGKKGNLPGSPQRKPMRSRLANHPVAWSSDLEPFACREDRAQGGASLPAWSSRPLPLQAVQHLPLPPPPNLGPQAPVTLT